MFEPLVAPPGIPHAPFEMVLVHPGVDREGRVPHERVLAGMRAAGLVGVVQRDASLERLGMVRGVLVTDAAGTPVRAGPTGPVAGLPLARIAARLQRAIGASVQCVAAGADGEPIGVAAWSEPPRFDAARSSQERSRGLVRRSPRAVSLVRRSAPLVRQHLEEIALSAGGAATLVPIGDRSIVVAAGAGFVPWAEELRPVVALTEREDRVELLAWLGRPPSGDPPGALRWGGEPSWSLTWEQPPTPIALAHEHPATLALQDRLRARRPLELPDRLVAELELQAPHRIALDLLWREHVPEVTAARVALALELPAEVVELASGAREAATLPGAEVHEPESIERGDGSRH